MEEGSRICRCDSCDWTGVYASLISGQHCPVCSSPDVEVDEYSFGFSEEGNYSQYTPEDLSRDIGESFAEYYADPKFWGGKDISKRIARGHYGSKNRCWGKDLDEVLITEMDIDREHQEGPLRLPIENLEDIAQDSAIAVNLWLGEVFGGMR